jgi:6-phosphogluconate dehydrogenase
MGVSGGEEGARTGPSLMPGGNPESYAELKPILEKVAAKTKDGSCVAFVGNGSAGHYTKMVHNGIEYAIMELISEVYGILLNAGFTNTQISELFAQWNDSPLQSFLIEITAEVLRKKDDQTKNDLVDMVLDKAKQKGTGMWTSQSAMELNVPLLSIDAAVSMRYISSLKEERMAIGGNKQKILINGTDKDKLPAICFHALQFGFLLAYGQGLHLLRTASDAYNYGIEIAEVLRIWKGGCIIRSALLDGLMNVYQQQGPGNILLDKKYHEVLTALRKDCKSLLIGAVNAEIPVPAFSASLSYFDAFSTQRLSTNLLQAQRDYFGAHGYERIDKPGNFHSDWHE